MIVTIRDTTETDGLYEREIRFEREGETLAGHKHALDHITLVLTGRVRFHGAGFNSVLGPGEQIETGATAEHSVTALEVHSIIVCRFIVPKGLDWALRREHPG